MYVHTLAHMCARFSPLKAPQGGSTVLKKIFPKALIRKTMVLVNSQSPLRHAHTHTHAHIPLHLNTILAAPLPSPLHPTSPPKSGRRRRKKQKIQKQNKKDSGRRRRERSTGRPGSGPYLPTAALLLLPHSTERLPSTQKPDPLSPSESHTNIYPYT